MRKINSKYENPIDNILISICEKIAPFFNKLNFTANKITTLSLLFGIISIIFLYENYVITSLIFFVVAYFFDCLDGFYARKYNMVTDFGDKYDHIKDLIVYILFFSVLYIKSKDKKKFFIIMIFIIIFSILSFIHLGCQQCLYNKDSEVGNTILNSFKSFCKKNPTKNINYTKYFGCGTFILVIVICTLYLQKF